MLFKTYYLLHNAHDIFEEISYKVRSFTDFSMDDFKNHIIVSLMYAKDLDAASSILSGYEYITKKLNKLIKVGIKYHQDWIQIKYKKPSKIKYDIDNANRFGYITDYFSSDNKSGYIYIAKSIKPIRISYINNGFTYIFKNMPFGYFINVKNKYIYKNNEKIGKITEKHNKKIIKNNQCHIAIYDNDDTIEFYPTKYIENNTIGLNKDQDKENLIATSKSIFTYKKEKILAKVEFKKDTSLNDELLIYLIAYAISYLIRSSIKDARMLTTYALMRR